MRLLGNYEAGYVMLVRSYNNIASMKTVLIRDRPSREQSMQERERGRDRTRLAGEERLELSFSPAEG